MARERHSPVLRVQGGPREALTGTEGAGWPEALPGQLGEPVRGSGMSEQGEELQAAGRCMALITGGLEKAGWDGEGRGEREVGREVVREAVREASSGPLIIASSKPPTQMWQ